MACIKTKPAYIWLGVASRAVICFCKVVINSDASRRGVSANVEESSGVINGAIPPRCIWRSRAK
ncbi:MAG TPA: hypothetical protein DCZ01_09965 [Elusimicrobia bacterium]|nr:MAG: hypothetical protein A2X37_02970 [Elusimicrobia bacterium GWA2_66_18]OGR72002.1 MAG: hypothetical protein A2X40_05115 [Elusimicrobia bacterium GWC2_65_9]HAZ08824.1 hypothetical protein [Elusimicrobiota bacterium]